MATSGSEVPKITLYTNHVCPWAHRAHIVIKELGLKYEEVIIPLDKPREPWYLEVNPRGLVPSIKISTSSRKDEIITESGVVSQFLVDAFPSHLVPTTGNPKGALVRARINFFVDTWFSKVGSLWFQIPLKDTDEEKEPLAKELIAAITNEIEPLLKDAAPFFGGSDKLTLAEALIAPFILRIYAFAKKDIIPLSILGELDALPNFSKWAAAVKKHESVTYIWDEEVLVEASVKKLASLKAQRK